jgi:hypothetical protein
MNDITWDEVIGLGLFIDWLIFFQEEHEEEIIGYQSKIKNVVQEEGGFRVIPHWTMLFDDEKSDWEYCNDRSILIKEEAGIESQPHGTIHIMEPGHDVPASVLSAPFTGPVLAEQFDSLPK